MNFEKKRRRSIADLDQKLWPFLFSSDDVISMQDSKMKVGLQRSRSQKICIKLKFGILDHYIGRQIQKHCYFLKI